MVVIPARNEETSIARAVESFPHDTVIVVDDHSEDGTAEAARKAGAGVLTAPDLTARRSRKIERLHGGRRLLTSRGFCLPTPTPGSSRFLNAVAAAAARTELAFLSIHSVAQRRDLLRTLLAPLAAAFIFAACAPARSGGSVQRAMRAGPARRLTNFGRPRRGAQRFHGRCEAGHPRTAASVEFRSRAGRSLGHAHFREPPSPSAQRISIHDAGSLGVDYCDVGQPRRWRCGRRRWRGWLWTGTTSSAAALLLAPVVIALGLVPQPVRAPASARHLRGGLQFWIGLAGRSPAANRVEGQDGLRVIIV